MRDVPTFMFEHDYAFVHSPAGAPSIPTHTVNHIRGPWYLIYLYD